MKIGVNLPDVDELATLGPGGLAAAARHAEQLGFESVCMPDLINADGSPALESVVALAAAAGATYRVRLGFGVLVLPLRAIAWLAAQIATLQHVSSDRVVLGIGFGGFPSTSIWRAVGIHPADRGRRTDAALDVLPRLIAGEPTRLEHEPEQPVVTLAPPARVPPLLIGGNSNVAIRRVARRGDAWFPSLLTPETVSRGAARLRELAAEHERPAPSITVGGHVAIGDDPSARDAFARSLVEDHGRAAEEAAQILMTGSPQAVAERFAAYADAGAERIVLAPIGARWMHHCELIAEARAALHPGEPGASATD